MADFTIGVGGDFLNLEAAATDPSNVNGNRGLLLDTLYTPNTNVAAFASSYELVPQQSTCNVDTSNISSGICLQGGVWGKVLFRRYNNTAAVVMQNASIDECTVYAPLQDGALVGCTGDLNAVTTLNGDATGLTGTDNKFVVNIAGVPGVYVDKVPGLWFDGVDDFVQTANVVGLGAADFYYMQKVYLSSVVNGATLFADGYGGAGGKRVGLVVSSSNSANVQIDDDIVFTNRNTQLGALLGYGEICLERSGSAVSVSRFDGENTFSDSFTNTQVAAAANPLTIGVTGVISSSPSGYCNCIVTSFLCGTSSETISLEYIRSGDFGSSSLTDHSGNGNDGTINGSTWVLSPEDPLTPKIGGSLLITSGPNAGKYAGSVQPITRLQGMSRPSLSIRVGI